MIYKKKGEIMSYTKDAQGNIVKKQWWKKTAAEPLGQPPLPPIPEDDLAGLEPTTEQLFQAVLTNQKAIYEELQLVKKDIELIKDDSVDEATKRFKELQNEVVEQIATLEKKKGAKK